MRADGKRRSRNKPRTRKKKNELDESEHGTQLVVGDRTTDKVRCSESGIPTDPLKVSVEVRTPIRARKRRNGRGAKGGRKVNA